MAHLFQTRAIFVRCLLLRCRVFLPLPHPLWTNRRWPVIMLAMHRTIGAHGRLRLRWSVDFHIAWATLVRVWRICVVMLGIRRLWRRHPILPLMRRLDIISWAVAPIWRHMRLWSWGPIDTIAGRHGTGSRARTSRWWARRPISCRIYHAMWRPLGCRRRCSLLRLGRQRRCRILRGWQRRRTPVN
jgi:hypothetical protein